MNVHELQAAASALPAEGATLPFELVATLTWIGDPEEKPGRAPNSTFTTQRIGVKDDPTDDNPLWMDTYGVAGIPLNSIVAIKGTAKRGSNKVFYNAKTVALAAPALQPPAAAPSPPKAAGAPVSGNGGERTPWVVGTTEDACYVLYAAYRRLYGQLHAQLTQEHGGEQSKKMIAYPEIIAQLLASAGAVMIGWTNGHLTRPAPSPEPAPWEEG